MVSDRSVLFSCPKCGGVLRRQFRRTGGDLWYTVWVCDLCRPCRGYTQKDLDKLLGEKFNQKDKEGDKSV